MNKTETIKICGKEVKMLYCAAAETGYESMSGKSSSVFSPQVVEYDDEGRPQKIEQPTASLDDYLKLALSAIIAAYGRDGGEPPLGADDILYNASPTEIKELIATTARLRSEWYGLPEVVNKEPLAENAEGEKN